ncbi:hypothetical protein B4113_1129 [Geobacillus sp. B4113_201601]|nr:hypothetical protein B4113_1129 [Geobacillus sp. B4113_201601]
MLYEITVSLMKESAQGLGAFFPAAALCAFTAARSLFQH